METLAGAPGVTGKADGISSAARFYEPADVVVASNGALFIADHRNALIRMITPDRMVSRVAGFATGLATDGPALKAVLTQPVGLRLAANGDIFIADEGAQAVRKLTPGGVIRTVAGGLMRSGAVDGAGEAARFNYPHGAKLDLAGNIYIADYRNCTVRRVTPEGMVTTLGGWPGHPGATEGTGARARFSQVRGVVVDRWDNLYVADYDNHTIRKGWPVTAAFPPVITVQPQGQTIAAGTSLTLSVGAGGSGVFSYQWWLDGAAILGETNDLLSIASALPINGGSYSVTVSNKLGSATSGAAVVRVLRSSGS